MGCFPFDENFGKFPVTNGTAFFPEFPEKRERARYIKSFGNFLPEISVPFDFLSRKIGKFL